MCSSPGVLLDDGVMPKFIQMCLKSNGSENAVQIQREPLVCGFTFLTVTEKVIKCECVLEVRDWNVLLQRICLCHAQ